MLRNKPCLAQLNIQLIEINNDYTIKKLKDLQMKQFLIILVLINVSCNGGKSKQNAKTKADSTANVQRVVSSDFKPDKNTTGAFEDKYPNGATKILGNYRFGKRDGTWAMFYESGVLWSENHYKNDTLNGSTTSYFENGKKRYSGFYKANKPSGTWEFYDTLGKVIQIKKY